MVWFLDAMLAWRRGLEITFRMVIVIVQTQAQSNYFSVSSMQLCIFSVSSTRITEADQHKLSMEIVQRRDAATLLPVTQAHVAPGTIIHSDEWAAYHQVAQLPHVSSHSTDFCESNRNSYTKHRVLLEQSKDYAQENEGVSCPSDEFLWRERHGPTKYQAFHSIINDIGLQYPVA